MELCRNVESAFLPLRCACRIPDGRFMTIQILAEGSDNVELTVVGIDIGNLGDAQRINQLVSDICFDYELARDGDDTSPTGYSPNLLHR
ncbi:MULTISPECIES: DUF1652 domain-containing protein [unclassified Pseudomonas]|uniref:DUF1652 domain-containing protein n=1 Tax=unclassified Pseudomonas TaxID=196821 RepID=UPI00244C3A68|nr:MULTISPECIES: DUF1652 domain-containing protein [unclassified Pseudomonas]MDG9924293.1 DUF1652 domain-containing protein [Pseudomonas sp. GD04045]MDH0033334.1 DUF1652 domain-containing protein [Pseudomonas sp. GD04019]